MADTLPKWHQAKEATAELALEYFTKITQSLEKARDLEPKHDRKHRLNRAVELHKLAVEALKEKVDGENYEFTREAKK